ncbi:MAG: AraC family transcriptional regulator [Alphaproteobacteria bacterium]|nr:AraC family transcriptional regulator [Alphaproteobacteria bacterium]MCB9795367.1 AraC family transcriptional regulator [Alphaproteobacteria bacterium]
MRELAPRCLAHAPLDGGNPTAVEGLHVYRRSAPGAPANAVYSPSLFLVVQGRKQAQVGEDVFVYDPDHYLVTSVPLPVVTQILEASEARPLLSLAVDLELADVREIMTQAGDTLAPPTTAPPERGLASSPVTPPIQDVARRLVDLLDRPEDAPILGPLYKRELLYEVLKGPRGGFLRAAALGSGHQRAIAEVLALIHADCTQMLSVSELAATAGMSESGFYEAFKAVTAATPLQYIKRLRLQEAHRQLTLGLSNVSGAAYGVGYNSLSQFSREFTRVFGENPSACMPR